MKPVEYLMLLSFVPAIIFILDIASLFLSRDQNPNFVQQPKLQIWLQDLLLFPPIFVAAMAWGFDRNDLETVIFPAVSLAVGFIVALDICSAYKIRSSFRRVLVFAALMASCVVCFWLGFILWYAERLVRARRTAPRTPDKTSRCIAAAVAAVYLVSFALPMGYGNPYGGLGIVRFSGFGTLHGQLYGLGAYIQSFQSFFVRFGAEDWSASPGFHFTPGDARLSWAANPCLWVATCFFLERRYAMAAFLGAGACAMAASVCGTTMFTLINSPGYAVWFASITALAVAALVIAFRRGARVH